MYKKIEKYSVEISLKSINNSDITKNNTREEKAIATNATEINKDICDTQNNIVVDHIKMMQRMFMVTKFTIICRKTEDKETIASLRRVPKMIVIMEILYSNKKKFHVLLKNLRSSSEKKIDGYLVTSYVHHKYIVKVIGFVNAKTDDIYDHIKLTQRNFQPNVYISHVGTNSLTTDMTPEEICEKIITFSKHLKSESNEVVVSGIVPRGDFY